MGQWDCPICGHMIDTPMHELGCPGKLGQAGQNTPDTRSTIITGSDLATQGGAELEALLQQQEEEFGSDLITIPILKVGQDLTAEVKRGDAERGEFINALSGESYGNEISFIVSYYQQGRFAATKDGKAYVAFGSTIPDAWEPLVGKEWVGQPFSEYPEAEERFKAAVNAKEREWGSGPVVSTTHNFTGLALIAPATPEDEEAMVPVRLSLKRTDVPAAKKFISLKKMLRLRAFWDMTFDLTTSPKQSGRHESFVVQVKAGRPTTDEERLVAVTLAQDVAAQRVQAGGDESEAPAPEPETPEGALGV